MLPISNNREMKKKSLKHWTTEDSNTLTLCIVNLEYILKKN